MAIRVYFGPYKHSPAPELPIDERFLWLTDFHLLRGMERDFWTSNPLQLDPFEPDQIRVWVDERWQPLPDAMDKAMDGWRDDEVIAKMPPGKHALAVVALLVWNASIAERAAGATKE
jgi:hypothetical protein